VGPGNAFVAEAKRQVFGTVGIDTIAGPSEICVISDANSDPAWIAADLMSQAEHDVSSQSILITPDETFANHVEAAVDSTSRAARFSSGLGIYDFLKRMSVQSMDAAGFAALAPAALKLAEAEGLPAHARSISIRTNSGGGHDE